MGAVDQDGTGPICQNGDSARVSDGDREQPRRGRRVHRSATYRRGQPARRRRVLGEDHPETLVSAGNLAGNLASLGEHQAARQLEEDMARHRRPLQDGDADG